MSEWPRKPFIYQINTFVWLNNLREQYQRPLTLADVPDEALDAIRDLGMDAVWLMGVWQRSEAARQSALNYTHEYRPVLPDLTGDDVIGSAYAIQDYTVDARLGGRKALAALRRRLRKRGLRLILDFVPNHVATDHPWITRQPHYLIRGDAETFEKYPGMFFVGGGNSSNGNGNNGDHAPLIIGHGRDPYFPSWIDTAQLNAFSAELRAAAHETLLDIAEQCDGVRCDMAMLMINRVFQQTWGAYVDTPQPETEYWAEVIPPVKETHPDFLFMAEVYWDMEHELQQLGFDFTYDKTLYDRLLEGDVWRVREHLRAETGFQQRMIRFIENHDEPRASASAGIEKSRALATVICTLPGGVLIHDGQLVGRAAKLPVQISRQPQEPAHRALNHFYRRLLAETTSALYRDGDWTMLDVTPAYTEGVSTHHNLLAFSCEFGDEQRLVVVNITPVWSQGLIRLDRWKHLNRRHWRLFDVLNGSCMYRSGSRVLNDGLYVECEPFQSFIYQLERVKKQQVEAYERRMNGLLR